ncbi:hypothetical protein N7326_05255 [Corynebacterium sp. ES2794-CONJ1]|uniref:hypothetical protein n=1 Tax=Corynebacterium sp. ES2794-CONJ1 TaxID=2980553 RepID=UPI0021D97122|nr:hypothetical protein [Corynebacterium sp. ES2794-CONJ1]MCU9519282.1 hypothetical protein [Corynebacterium sp. ES2794-CONJ1]
MSPMQSALAAPRSSLLLGTLGGGIIGAVVALFREMGNFLLVAVTWQSFLSDALDKALVFLIARRNAQRCD